MLIDLVAVVAKLSGVLLLLLLVWQILRLLDGGG